MALNERRMLLVLGTNGGNADPALAFDVRTGDPLGLDRLEEPPISAVRKFIGDSRITREEAIFYGIQMQGGENIVVARGIAQRNVLNAKDREWVVAESKSPNSLSAFRARIIGRFGRRRVRLGHFLRWDGRERSAPEIAWALQHTHHHSNKWKIALFVVVLGAAMAAIAAARSRNGGSPPPSDTPAASQAQVRVGQVVDQAHNQLLSLVEPYKKLRQGFMKDVLWEEFLLIVNKETRDMLLRLEPLVGFNKDNTWGLSRFWPENVEFRQTHKYLPLNINRFERAMNATVLSDCATGYEKMIRARPTPTVTCYGWPEYQRLHEMQLREALRADMSPEEFESLTRTWA